MNKAIKSVALLLVLNLAAFAQQNFTAYNPLYYAKLIGDKLIKETSFKYNLTLFRNNPVFNGLQSINFERTFNVDKPAVAYGYTTLDVPNNLDIAVQLEHNDGLKIWLNDELVYQYVGNKDVKITYDERSLELSQSCVLKLKKGKNKLLVKSETRGKEWVFLMQPPSTKGAINKVVTSPTIGLKNVPYVSSSITSVSNWLIIGPFKNPEIAGVRNGINEAYPPEKEIEFGRMYAGLNQDITWTIPKIEILGALINPLEWGTNYQWNYHNGGVAWAMQQLAERTGDQKYDNYATNYGDFHLNGLPFVNYQVKSLYADSSANSQIIDTKLLDFALAPSLPLIYKLRKQKEFLYRDKYSDFVNKMMNYAKYEQLRFPKQQIYTRTSPEKYTTWVDDMFMGIPFLMQASQYAEDEETKTFFMDDAAQQVLEYKAQVWDPEAELYVHAKFSSRNVKLPHWSRANGWAIWAMSDVLAYLPKTHKHYKAILNQFQTHAKSLKRYQNSRGFWPNVLDYPSSKDEVSGTAIFTMAMARGIKNGWLDRKTFLPIVLNGWKAIQSQIEPDGTVHNICMGTMCSEDINYYLNRPFFDDDTHGLFAVLFAAIEVDKLIDKP